MENFEVYSRLQEAIKICKTNRAELIEKTGYNPSAISKILNGVNKITPQFIKIFCCAYGVSEIWLTTGKGEMFKTLGVNADLKIELFKKIEGVPRSGLHSLLAYASKMKEKSK